jgi:hypothetical protein
MARLALTCLLLFGHSFLMRLVAQTSPNTQAYYDSLSALLPSFDSFPPAFSYNGVPAKVNLTSPWWARRFRTKLREGAKEGPNFDGHYTLIFWGCGSSCQMHAVVDAVTGRVFPDRLATSIDLDYRRESSLLIADPVSTLIAMFGDDSTVRDCAPCGTPAAYRWTGTSFEPAGSGEHIHVVPPGPPEIPTKP